MNYLIDGHNLIAHIPGLDLGMPDDEERLIWLLNRYGEHHRGGLEVYFDGAPTSVAGTHNYGRVTAHFVPKRTTADAAIGKRLVQLGKSARNWVVVSSDRSVQANGRAVHAGVLSSEDFAMDLQDSVLASDRDKDGSANQMPSPAEVEEWLAIFKKRKSTN